MNKAPRIFYISIVSALCCLVFFYLIQARFHLNGLAGGLAPVISGGRYILECISINIPFLFLTVVLPLLGILWSLRRKPIGEQRIMIHQTGLSKGVFFICLFVFLFLQAYGIYYYKLRLEIGGNETDILNYLTHRDIYYHMSWAYEHLRFAYVLNKIFLMLGMALHLPLSIVGRIYCLNDACFHLFIALSILYFTKRYDLASVVIAAPILLTCINYYFFTLEIYLSGAIMILYIAVYKGLKDGSARNLILYPSLFFIIWSHPLTIIMLAAFLPGIYKSPADLKKDKWILSFIFLNIAVRMLLMTGEDHDRILDLFGKIDSNQLAVVIVKYSVTYWYIILLAIIGLCISLVTSKGITNYAGLLLLPLMLYLATVKQLSTDEVNFMKFTYPINLFILTRGVVLVLRYGSKYKWTILAGTFIILFTGLGRIFACHSFFMNRVVLMETLNTICYKEDPNQSKWYVSGDSLNSLDPFPSIAESICYSCYQHLPIAIEVVRDVPPGLKKIMDTIPTCLYLVAANRDSGWITTDSIKSLNPYYFHFREGRYKELVMDSAKMSILRDAYPKKKVWVQKMCFWL